MNRKDAKAQRFMRVIGVMALLMGLILPYPVSAQQTLTIESLLVQLWPEFDQPSMLVQYTGQMSATGEVTLTFTLPDTAALHVTAYVDEASGEYVEIIDPVAAGNQVTITTPNGSFHIEFYDTALDLRQPERSYTLTWAGDYAVSVLQWSLQAPPDISDVQISPTATGPIQQGQFDYYTALASNVAQGESATFTLSYVKTDNVLTVNVTPAEPLSDAEAMQPRDNPALILSLAVVVLAVIGFGVGYYLRRKQRATSSEQRAKGKKQPATSSQQPVKSKEQEQAAGGRFCTQCGAAVVSAEDKFCRTCGAALRT